MYLNILSQWYNQVINYLDQHSFYASLVSTTLIGLFVLARNSKLGWLIFLPFYRKGKLSSKYFAETVNHAHRYYIPNNFNIFSRDKTETILPDRKTRKQELRLVDLYGILTTGDTAPCYLLIAPTGVGKSTFLANLYLLSKERKRWFSLRPVVVFGGINEPETHKYIDRLIHRGIAKHHILLLDGLDEFRHQSIKDSERSIDEYHSEFRKFWSDLSTKIANFHSVVISVREQFLESDELINTTFQKGFPRTAQVIQLEHFNNKQRDAYLQRVFYPEKSLRYYFSEVARVNFRSAKNRADTIISSTSTLIENRGFDFLNLPLVLQYADAVTSVVLKKRKGFLCFSVYELFTTIVESWLQREFDQRKFTLIEKEQIRQFCENVAYAMAFSNKKYLGQKELVNIESKLVSLFFKGMGERALLIRKNVNGQGIYQFAHGDIMEYFLAQYLNRFKGMPPAELPEKNIHFYLYPSALQIIVGQRWIERSPKLTTFLAYPSLIEDKINPLPYTDGDRPSLQIAIEFIDALINNQGARIILQGHPYQHSSSEINRLQEIIHQEQLLENDFEKRFLGLSRLTIFNENFWNKNHDSVFPGVKRFVGYFKNFIEDIHFSKIGITDTDLSCFARINSLTDLMIMDINTLDGSFLQYFASSRYKIEYLVICFTSLKDENLNYLNGADRIEFLLLSHNFQFNGDGLKFLSQSAFTLHRLTLGPEIVFADKLNVFKEAHMIAGLEIGTRGKRLLPYLKCFSKSFNAIENLTIGHNVIIEANIPFSTHFPNLKELQFRDNCVFEDKTEIQKAIKKGVKVTFGNG